MKPFLTLLDSGSKTSWFNQHSLPSNSVPSVTYSISGVTMAEKFKSNQQITIHQLHLPEIQSNITLNKLHAQVFTAVCRYDIILGRDALVCKETQEVECCATSVLSSTAIAICEQSISTFHYSFVFEILNQLVHVVVHN